MIVEPSLVETDPVMSVKRWTNSDRHGQQTNGDQKSSLEPGEQNRTQTGMLSKSQLCITVHKSTNVYSFYPNTIQSKGSKGST